MRLFLCAALLVAACLVEPLYAATPSVVGHVVDPGGLPLPGVAVTLRPDDGGGGTPLAVTTDAGGRYEFDDVPKGHYDLDASLEGFEGAARRNLDVEGDTVDVELKLALAELHQEITVVAQAPLNVIGAAEPNAPVTVTRTVMDVAMLPNMQFDDVLPLMPNVVRGPDGLIAVGGARAETGGLFVNGVTADNPLTGGAGVMLPLEAVENMQVYAAGAPAEYSHATGGVVAVSTRPGTDHFHVSLDSFFPRLYYTDGGIGGIEYWDPNAGVSGPIVRGRVTFMEGISYRYDRNSFTTLKGDDHNVFNALYSWTQVDAKLTTSQRLRVSIGADPRHTDRANITAFTPSDAAPHVDQGGWTGRISDAITAGRTLIELQASSLDTQATVQPHGSDPFVVTHQLTSGSYYDQQDRQAQTIGAGMRVTWSMAGGALITAGVSMNREQADQTMNSGPVSMLRSDGALSREISVLQPSGGSVESTNAGVFVQGHWTARPWLTVDAGLRYDDTTNAGDPPPSPRFGWTMSRDQGRTTLSGSVGLFADAMPLNALAFPLLPVRVIAVPGPDGTTTTIQPNVLSPDLEVPRAIRWDLDFARNAGPWTIRVRYQERHSTHDLIVEPSGAASGAGDLTAVTSDLVLSSTGSSQSRSLETTAGFRPKGHEFYVSYVRAATLGDQNSLDATEGLMRPTFEQINQRGPLPIDVPHRVLAWGLFHVPGGLTFAPFLDTRSGFPYTAINDNWLFVEPPGTHRLPWMAALDLSATRIVSVSHHLPDVRLGLKLYNVVRINSERAVQRDIDRADFGTQYDPVPRDFSVVFEFLWGRNHHP